MNFVLIYYFLKIIYYIFTINNCKYHLQYHQNYEILKDTLKKMCARTEIYKILQREIKEDLSN